MAIKNRIALAVLGLALAAAPALAQKRYGPGASDTEIKIGNTMPYSGPVSAYGTIGKVESAYFKMINEQGGINGRKIDFISLDDGYSPPKTVEMVRRLVEQDEVLFLMGTLGTPSNTAIHKYMNQKKVPHLFLATGASKWNDPRNFPWTVGFNVNYQSEARLYAQDILRHHPNGKIAVLYQNDDYGKDYLKGFMDGLGAKAQTMIIKTATYEVSDPTVDSQMVSLQGSGADIFFNITTPKFAAQAIRKAGELGWKPVHYLNQVSQSVGSVLKPAGLDKSVGLISMQYTKDPTDPKWANDAAMKEYFAFMKKYLPEVDPSDGNAAYGMAVSQLAVHLLQQCGNDLTRENVLKQATSFHNFQIPMALPGVTVSNSPTNYELFHSMQLVHFDGKTWVGDGEPVAVK